MSEYSEFSKISIHQHFGGENFSFDRRIDEAYNKKLVFDWSHSLRIINDAVSNQFNMIAMTNANVFDATKYFILRNIARKNSVELLPGVELNLIDNKKIAHVVVIFDPESDLIGIQATLDKFINENQNNSININQLVELIVLKRVILIPHGIKQGQRSLGHHVDLIKYLYDIRDAVPILIEYNNNYHKETLKNKIKKLLDPEKVEWIENVGNVSGADRETLSSIISPTYIWGESTFSDLYYAALMSDNDGKNTRIKRRDDIVNKIGYIKEIIIKKSDKTLIESITLKCSHGLNSIIGPSGSGKTLLLNLIKKKLKNENLENRSIAGDYDSISDVNDIELIDENGSKIPFDSITIFEGLNLYNKILDAYKSDKSELFKQFDISIDDSVFADKVSGFQKEINRYVKNEKKLIIERKKITLSMQSILATSEFLSKNQTRQDFQIKYVIMEDFNDILKTLLLRKKEYNEDLNNINKYFDYIIKISAKYVNDSIINELQISRKSIRKAIEKRILENDLKTINIKIQKHKKDKLFLLVDAHNNKMGHQVRLINSKQQELIQFNNALWSSLKKAYVLEKFNEVPSIDKKTIASTIQLLPNKYARINMKDFRLSIKKDELKEMFPSQIADREATNRIGIRYFAKSEYDLSNKYDVVELVKPFIEREATDAIAIVLKSDRLLIYDLELKINEKDYLPIESITAGMLSKIYINKMFEDNLQGKNSKTIILYDQPDVNMEKEFILDELVKKLQDLKNSYQIFITTHEPLLVINADSNNIINAKNDKKVGERISIKYGNISLGSSASKAEVYKSVSRLIDGSHKAVKLRSKIYGGMINENQD